MEPDWILDLLSDLYDGQYDCEEWVFPSEAGNIHYDPEEGSFAMFGSNGFSVSMTGLNKLSEPCRKYFFSQALRMLYAAKLEEQGAKVFK